MPRRFPIHNGPLSLPASAASWNVTLRGAASLVIQDGTGHTVFEASTPDAKPADVSTVTLDLSSIHDTPADYTATVIGNVQATVTTSGG